jgi:hypothetical protein
MKTVTMNFSDGTTAVIRRQLLWRYCMTGLHKEISQAFTSKCYMGPVAANLRMINLGVSSIISMKLAAYRQQTMRHYMNYTE